LGTNLFSFFLMCLSQLLVGSVSQAEDVNWWGHKYGFVSGGFLGATSRKNKIKDPSNVRHTFGEEDQENLYNLVQVGMLCT
jgi:membrane associated rhomboid family serine protease